MQTCPSANYYEYKAIAIGARSQAAKTYLERSLDSLPSSTVDDLITHSLRALAGSVQVGKNLPLPHPSSIYLLHTPSERGAFPRVSTSTSSKSPFIPTPPLFFLLIDRQDGELTNKNCAVAVVGEDMPFTVLEGDALQSYLEALQEDDAGDGEPAAAATDVDMAA